MATRELSHYPLLPIFDCFAHLFVLLSLGGDIHPRAHTGPAAATASLPVTFPANLFTLLGSQ